MLNKVLYTRFSYTRDNAGYDQTMLEADEKMKKIRLS